MYSICIVNLSMTFCKRYNRYYYSDVFLRIQFTRNKNQAHTLLKKIRSPYVNLNKTFCKGCTYTNYSDVFPNVQFTRNTNKHKDYHKSNKMTWLCTVEAPHTFPNCSNIATDTVVTR